MRDALGAVQSVLVLGGSSEIGVAIAAELAGPRHATVLLAGRRPDAMPVDALEGAGRVETLAFDADDTAGHEAFVGQAWDKAAGDIDVVVLAFGLLGDQAADEAGGDGAVRVATTNYVGAVSVGLAVARRLRAQGHGTLVVLSSVAGERVRRANFVYGSTKAGLDGFAQGLGDSLVGSGASVLVVRPGFVKGRMTAGMDPAPFATTPDAVAKATAAALAAGKEIVWVPGVLRYVFAVMRHLPRALWRRVPGVGAAGRSGVAAFDFDGTLVAGDSLAPFLRRLLGTRAVGGIAASLPAMAAAHRRGGRDAAKAVLLRRVLRGQPAADVERVGAAFGMQLAERVRPEMAGRLTWHRALGHRLVLVSASLTAYLEPFAATTGFDDVIASRLEVGAGGVLTGRLVGANVRGEEKATRLRALLAGIPDPELWAYGDSAGDRQLLAMADHPTWVGGRPR